MEFIKSYDRIYCEDKDGKLLAEITFPETVDDIVNINHTFVDESLRGQGVAGQLMQAVVDYIIENKNHGCNEICLNWHQEGYDSIHR